MKSAQIAMDQILQDDVLDQVVGGLNPQPEPPSSVGRFVLWGTRSFFPPSPATLSFARASG